MKHIIILTILMLCLTSCASNKGTMNRNEHPYLKYSITIGQGGGFTASNEGFVIDSSGVIKSFKGFLLKDPRTEYKGKLNDEQIRKLNSSFPEILMLNYSVKGNMTSYLVLKNIDGETRFSWPGVSPDNDVPQALRDFYNNLNRIINSTK